MMNLPAGENIFIKNHSEIVFALMSFFHQNTIPEVNTNVIWFLKRVRMNKLPDMLNHLSHFLFSFSRVYMKFNKNKKFFGDEAKFTYISDQTLKKISDHIEKLLRKDIIQTQLRSPNISNLNKLLSMIGITANLNNLQISNHQLLDSLFELMTAEEIRNVTERNLTMLMFIFTSKLNEEYFANPSEVAIKGIQILHTELDSRISNINDGLLRYVFRYFRELKYGGMYDQISKYHNLDLTYEIAKSRLSEKLASEQPNEK